MYWIATYGPIEVGRVTYLDGAKPYFVTINAVSSLIPPCTPYLTEQQLVKSFADLFEAQAYAVSYWKSTDIYWEFHE